MVLADDVPFSRGQWSGLMVAFGLGLGALQFAGILALGSLSATAGAALALLACAHASLRHQRRSRFLQQACTDGNRLVAQGRLDEARRVLVDASKHARLVPHLHALLLFCRGIVELLQGSLGPARTLFARAVGSGWLEPTGPLSGSYAEVCLWMSLCEVISGDISQACVWRSRVATPIPPPPPLAAHHLLLDVLIACRQGRYDDALQRHELGIANARRHLNQRELATLDVVAGFALERARGGSYRQHADQIVDWRELDGIDLSHLVVRWPELAQFLARRGL